MRYDPRYGPTEKPSGGAGRKVLFALLLVLLFATSAAITFVAMGGHKGLPMFQKAPEAYVVSGQISALRLAAPEDAGEAALREYFGEAVAFASENGINTLLFEAKQGLKVWWRDDIFPPADGVAGQDTWRHRSDPLAILCESLAGEGIQLWLEVDPYEWGDVPAGSKSEVAKLLKTHTPEAFAAGDADYETLLAKSLGALPKRYPVSGIVFSGLEDALTGGGAGEDFRGFLEQLHTSLADTGRLPALGLAYDEQSTAAPNTAYAKGLRDEGLLTYALPLVRTGEDTAARMSALSVLGDGLVLQAPADDNGLVLFFAGRNTTLSGVLYGTWPAAVADTGYYAFLSASLAGAGSPLPTGFEVPAMLTVNYPAQNARIYTDQLYIMGASDPAQPLLLDGAEVPAENRAAGGSFGVAVDLAAGANSFTFTQGEKSVTLNVTRQAATGGTATYPQDHTHEAKAGQVVKVVSQIASALTVPGDLSAINETLPAGATFVATGSTRIRRSGTTSWAYQMPSGDWVQAVNCQWQDGDGKAAFTGLTATADAEKRGEWLDFEGTGSPAAYIQYHNDTGLLTLTFYDTTFTLPDGFSSQFVQQAEVAPGENGSTVLTLRTWGLWGYNIEYGENSTRLFLKGVPTLSGDPARPLAGIRVMLDPGHGDGDLGAPGIMGDIGPNEKHVNLAQAQAIAYRLEQLGATVIMTRTGDEFYELEERLAMQNQQKPDFFLSVHHNSVDLDRDRSGAKGVEAYYYHPYNTPPSKDFAQNLVDRVAAASGRTKRKDADWGYYYVTRSTVCPSVLFEYGFMVSPGEFEDIISADSLYTVAFATVEALMETIPK